MEKSALKLRKRKREDNGQANNKEKLAKIDGNQSGNGDVASVTNPLDDEDSADDQPEDKLKFSGSLNLKQFRKKLQNGNCNFEIRHFLEEASSNSHVIGKYLNAGGKPLELIQALKNLDQDDLNQISNLFSALHLVLIEIITNQTELTALTVEACKFLLNNHRNCFEKVLRSYQNRHRKCALKLLTAIVALDTQFGRDILNTITVVFNAETLDRFTKHSKTNVRNEEESVRTCYIHFVLSYLIEGNMVLIRNILDRNELILAIVSGMQYDSAETVSLVLSTLHKFVLRNFQISKTKKVQIFNVDVIKEFLVLFEWKGPKCFAALFDRKVTNLNDYVDNSELNDVTGVLYEFLVTLLTSRKYGIAFQSLGHRRTKSNNIQKRVLVDLQKPWENEKKSLLVLEILKACPELARNYFRDNAYLINLSNKTIDFFKSIDYLRLIISSLKPSIIRVGIEQMNVKETIEVVKALCMSPEILQYLRNNSTIRNADIRIRHRATELLFIMFQHCNQFLYQISSWNVFSSSDIKKIKFDFINHIFVMCPSVENILLSLHATLTTSAAATATTTNQDDSNVFGHLETVLDLLLIIAKSLPAFIEKTSSVINYINILRPIYEENREHGSSTRIEFKAIQLIMALEPKAMRPDGDFFEQVVKSFLNILWFGSDEEQREVKPLLRDVLKITGLFENGILEIDLWLEAFKEIGAEELPQVQDFFINTLVEGNGQDLEVISLDTLAGGGGEQMTRRNVTELFEKIENGVALSGTIDTLTTSYFLQYFVSKLPSDDDNSATEPIMNYLENVAFYLFHYLPTPQAVYHLLKGKNHKYSKYMKNWIRNARPGQLIVHKSDTFKRFYSALLSSEPITFLELFGKTESGVEFMINGNKENLNPILSNETQVMILFYTTVFVAIQQIEGDDFDGKSLSKITGLLKNFIEILNQTSALNCDESVSGFETENVTSPLYRALKYIFCSRFYFLDKFDIITNGPVAMLIVDLVAYIRPLIDSDQLDLLLLHYQSKISNQIEALQPTVPVEQETLFKTISTITLKSSNCLAILNNIAQIQFGSTSNDGKISVVIVISYCLKQLSEYKSECLDEDVVKLIVKIYIDLNRLLDVDVNLEPFEEGILCYLTVFYKSIGCVPPDLFSVIFEAKKLTKSNIKLATLLLDRNPVFGERFLQIMPEHVTRKELIYPLLNIVACRQNINIDAVSLNSIYDQFKNGIAKAIEKPQKAGIIYRENIYSTLWLIERCMPINDCVGFCKKNLKFDSAELYQLQIIKAIHLKALTSPTADHQQIFTNFINISIQLCTTVLKRDVVDFDKINGFATIVFGWFYLTHRLKSLTSISYEKITKSSAWSVFAKSCLKLGIRLDENDDHDGSILLKLFGYLSDCLYVNGVNNEDVARYFEMAISHSEFLNVALNQKPNNVKTYLMYVLHVLLQKDASAIRSNQIPIFLGAYQAKLSRCDRFILAILQKCEQYGISMQEFKPLIWGESAISHYSLIKSEVEEKVNLIQEPPMMHALALIDRETAEQTLYNFPIWRRLNAIEQTPTIEFICPNIPGNEYIDDVSIATTELEKCVDRNQFDADLLLLASRSEDSYADIYDPAFYIPLMSMAFGPETYTRPLRPAQYGLLAMTFAALSSQDKPLRLATGNALMRYRSHLEMTRFVDNKIWFHLFNCVQNGLGDLTHELRKHKKSRIARVPYVAGIFLARTVNVLMNPVSEMYRPLTSFLLLKNSFDFLAVPEFNVLFQSPEPNHTVYRYFILEVLRDGMKCGSDFTVLMQFNIFKALLSFYDTSMSTRDINLLILVVINAAVRIPKSAKVMIQNVGLISWLNAVAVNVEFFHFDIIDGLCSIISNLWHSVKFNHQDYNNVSEIELRMFNVMLTLCPKLSTRTAQKPFAKFLNIFCKITAADPSIYRFCSEVNIDHLIECCKDHVKESGVFDLKLVKENGEMFSDTKSSYVKELRSLGWNEMLVFINATLRQIILDWTKWNKVVV